MADLQNDLKSEVIMNPKKRAHIWLRLTRLHLRQGDIEGAIRVLQTAIEEFPQHNFSPFSITDYTANFRV